MAELHLVGAGGHGRVASDAAMSMGCYGKVVWYDDAWQYLKPVGPVDQIFSTSALYEASAPRDCFVAIGHTDVRMKLIGRLLNLDHKVVTLVHERSVVSPHAVIAEGSIVMAGAVIQSLTIIGAGSIVNTGATVDHDCQLGSGVHVAPGAHLAGNVRVADGTMIGAGSVVREGVSIGAGCMIGAGAVVVHDVPESAVCFGNPARVRDS